MAQTLTHSQSVRNNCALESSDPCLLWLIFKVQQPKQRVSCGIEKSSRRKVKAYVLLDLRKTFPFYGGVDKAHGFYPRFEHGT